MKKTVLVLTSLLSGLFLFSSCSKDEFRNFEESYSYKLSGKLVLLSEQYADSTAAVQQEHLQEVPLAMEQGQMRVFDEGENRVTMTFNDVSGNVTVAKGMQREGGFVLDENQEKLVGLDDGTLTSRKSYVRYSGTAKFYDSAVLFQLKYAGKVSYKLQTMDIVDSFVECVAVEND